MTTTYPRPLTEPQLGYWFEQGLKRVLADWGYKPAAQDDWTPATDDHEHECWQYMGPTYQTPDPHEPTGEHTFRHRNHPKWGRVYVQVRAGSCHEQKYWVGVVMERNKPHTWAKQEETDR